MSRVRVESVLSATSTGLSTAVLTFQQQLQRQQMIDCRAYLRDPSILLFHKKIKNKNLITTLHSSFHSFEFTRSKNSTPRSQQQPPIPPPPAHSSTTRSGESEAHQQRQRTPAGLSQSAAGNSSNSRNLEAHNAIIELSSKRMMNKNAPLIAACILAAAAAPTNAFSVDSLRISDSCTGGNIQATGISIQCNESSDCNGGDTAIVTGSREL